MKELWSSTEYFFAGVWCGAMFVAAIQVGVQIAEMMK